MECSGKRSEEEVAENIDPKMAKELLQSGYRYLDVRTVNEYRKGNVKDSINIPYWFLNSKGRETNPQFMELVLKSFSKDDYIVVACASGTRSAAASLDLINSVSLFLPSFSYDAILENSYINSSFLVLVNSDHCIPYWKTVILLISRLHAPFYRQNLLHQFEIE